MPRSGRLRTFIKEYSESPKIEKISFIPPFIIVAVEIILLIHALSSGDIVVVQLTSILVVISVIEIILVGDEIHDHYLRGNYEKILAIKLDDFITKTKQSNVRIIVQEFIDEYPEYKGHRGEIYRTSCQVLETHKEEVFEKEITQKLKKFIKKTDEKNVDDIIYKFIRKNPKYKKNRQKIYRLTCKLLEKIEKNNKL
jgi:hypothetical protein